MKVLAYLWSFPPLRYTGGELMTLELLEYLAGQGHDVAIYAHNAKQDTQYRGMTIQPSARLHYTVTRDYDVLVTHPEIRVNEWQHVKHLPYVGIVHNVNPNTLRSLDRQPPTLTIVNSQYTRTHIPQSAVHHGAGVHIIHPPVLIEPTDGPHDTYGVVNMSLEKGGAVLNVTAATLPDLRFLGVVGGHGLQVLHQPSNVTVVEPTPNMAGIYARMRALMFPTHSETYGKVVAEAMVCGVPVLASDLPAVREAGGDAVQYLDPYEYDCWAKAVKRMEDADTYGEWQARARARGLELRDDTARNLAHFEHLVMGIAG